MVRIAAALGERGKQGGLCLWDREEVRVCEPGNKENGMKPDL